MTLIALPAGAATLAGVRVDPQPGGGAVVTVQFVGPPPHFHVIGAGSTEASVIFDGAQLGPQIAPTIAGAGAVSSVSVATQGSGVTVSLHLRTASPISVVPRGSAILVNVLPAQASSDDDDNTPTPSPLLSAGTLVVVIPLKYADISEIAGILVPGANVASNDNFQPVVTNLGSSSVGQSGGTFGGFQQAAQTPQTFGGAFNQQSSGLGQRLNDNIAVDRRLNAIVLTGTQAIIDNYKGLIAKLDVPLQSVILETQIVELTESAAKDVGIDFFPNGGAALVNGNSASTSTTGITTRSNGYVIGTQEMASGQLSFNANLNAQITLGNGKVLAKPRILAQSGAAASILTGEAIPIFTSVVVAGASALTSQQVNYVNVGVNLQIQPRISSDGYVTSHIYSEVSSVTEYTNSVPEIAQRTASTVATVKDGESFVIGGLLEDDDIKSLIKLPFIGDLPLIGSFFRHYTSSHSIDNLYIIVTPHIVGGISSPPQATQVVVPPNLAAPAPVAPAGVPVASPVPSPSSRPQR